MKLITNLFISARGQGVYEEYDYSDYSDGNYYDESSHAYDTDGEPPNFTSEPQNLSIEVGEDVTFNCDVENLG